MVSKNQPVYIVILNYNNFRCSDFCLQSLREIPADQINIILVDNNSTDDSYNRLLEKYPECYGIRSHENLGFARGSNIGLRYAYEKGASYFMLLNNDVEVEPDFLKPLLEGLDQKDVEMVTPKILYRNNKQLIWHAGGHIKNNTVSAIARGYDEIDEGQYNEPVFTEWASGACCLFSRKLVDTIGFLEERYFFGQEEWDFSTSTIRAGFKILYEPKSVVYHEIAQSSRKSPALYGYQIVYNKVVYASKFLNKVFFWPWLNFYVAHIIMFFPKKALHHADNSTDFYLKSAKKAALMGVRDAIRNVHVDEKLLKALDKSLHTWYSAKYSPPQP